MWVAPTIAEFGDASPDMGNYCVTGHGWFNTCVSGSGSNNYCGLGTYNGRIE